jgi:hypothetical protein
VDLDVAVKQITSVINVRCGDIYRFSVQAADTVQQVFWILTFFGNPDTHPVNVRHIARIFPGTGFSTVFYLYAEGHLLIPFA